MVTCSFRWNLAYADAYADLLWEKNTIRLLKSIAAEQGVFFLIQFKKFLEACQNLDINIGVPIL